MFKFLLNMFLNESGIEPVTATLIAGGLAGGGSLLGGLLGKNKTKTIDPYGELRNQFKANMLGNVGREGSPYQYNPAFEIPQPDVEKAVESTVLGKLGNLPGKRTDIQDIGQKYYAAQKEQMQERHADEMEANKNMYNRLGLVSSTPGLKARTDLGRKQGQEFNVLEADLAMQGIDQEMRATALAEDIANMYLGQGQQLGQLQRGYSQFPIEMSMRDTERMSNEELAWANMISGLLGGNPPQYYNEPNAASQIGGSMQDIGSLMMMYNMMGGGNMGGGGMSRLGNYYGPNTPYGVQDMGTYSRLGGR